MEVTPGTYVHFRLRSKCHKTTIDNGMLIPQRVLYDAIAQWNRSGSVSVDEISQPFFNDLVPSIEQDTYVANTTEYDTIVYV